jgi:hypothetical protein
MKNRDEARLAILTRRAPGIGAVGAWVPLKIENVHDAVPTKLIPEPFSNRDRLNSLGSRICLGLHGLLKFLGIDNFPVS